LSALIAEYPPADPILDAGCGSGDLAISLAERGHQVLGVDFIDAAVGQAREKAAALPAGVARLVDFRTADALRRQTRPKFDRSIWIQHLFDPTNATFFAGRTAAALRPEGRYYVLAFAVEYPLPNTPRRISADELRSRFTSERGWRILEIRPAEFLSRIAPVPAIGACIERLPDGRA
jgi:cyclopropane fatty-acyl-phospholipid synthase-like methyltransferase